MRTNRRGSALLTAILLSAIFLTAVAALLTIAHTEYRGSLKSYFDTAAFSLAESGIDRAAAFIKANGIAGAVTTVPTTVTDESGVWYKKVVGSTTAYYRGYFPSVDLRNNRIGTCSVIVKPGIASGSKTTYSVYSLGTAKGGKGGNDIVSQRAIHTELDYSTSSSGKGGAAVAAKTKLDFGSGANENPFDVPNRKAHFLVASYDSTKNNGKADMTVNFATGAVSGLNYGDAATIGLKDVNGKATLYGCIIYGTVAVGGSATTLTVTANPKTGKSASEWPSQNPYVASVIDLAAAAKYTNSASTANPYMGFNMDSEGTGGLGDNVVYNYAFPSDLFSLTGFLKDPVSGAYTTFDTSNYTATKAINGHNNKELDSMNANSSKTVLGPSNYKAGDNTKTVTSLGNVAGLGEIVVKGDAVLILTGGANMNNGDGVKLSFVDSTSKLTIVLADSSSYNIKFANADNNISDDDNLDKTNNIKGVGYKPERLLITSSQAAAFKMDIGSQKDAAAIVKIPNGTVSVVCQDQNNSHQFRGQLIADKVDLTGTTYLDIFYDINTGGGGGVGAGITLSRWQQIMPSAFTAQL